MTMNLDEIFDMVTKRVVTNGMRIFEVKKISYGIQFKISDGEHSELLRIYQNKKNETKYDYSQIRNEPFKVKIQKIIQDPQFVEISSNKDYGYPIIGTDEAGKGDYFGPLVSAGVFVKDENEAKTLASIGVKDSKELSDNQNIELAEKIKEICKYHFSVIEISPRTYNNLYSQFKHESKNLNTLLAWAHAKVIEELLSRVECNKAVIDQFANEKFLLNKLQEKGKRIEIIQIHKAEENIAVAAASNLARAKYLEKLSKLSEEFKMNFPKGASEKAIEMAKLFVEKYGEEKLQDIAKLHFKTTNSV